MGSFNPICSISRQTVLPGQKVIAVPLEELSARDYIPSGFPVVGTSEDAGTIILDNDSGLDVLQGTYFVCLVEAYDFIYKYAEENEFYGLITSLGYEDEINRLFRADDFESRFIIQDYFTKYSSSVSYTLAKSMGDSLKYYQDNREKFLKLINLKHILYQFNVELVPSYWGNQDSDNDYGKHLLDLIMYVRQTPNIEDYIKSRVKYYSDLKKCYRIH